MLYNPIGLVDGRFDRPWDSTDDGYKRTLGATYPVSPRGPDALRLAQPGGVDAGVRDATRASATRGR